MKTPGPPYHYHPKRSLRRVWWGHPWVRKTRRWYLERYVYPKLCVGCGNPKDEGAHGWVCVMGPGY